MREILFRGKRKNNGEWVFGDLVRLQDGNDGKLHIYGYGEVLSETVGQYTGLADKNGKKIFEGDIIRGVDNKLMSVRWNFETLFWELTDVEVPDNEVNHFLNTYPLGEIQLESCYGEMISEIVGNIHDNPELLKGGEEE